MKQRESWSEPGSRMPGDDAYWDGLARRITDDAAEALDSIRNRPSPWLELASRHARSLMVLATAAVLAGLALFPTVTAESAAETDVLARTIQPPGHMGLDGMAPPRLEAMLLPEGGPRP